MTDLELAAALREVLAAAPSEYPNTRALLEPARPRPTIVRMSTIHEPTGPAPKRVPEAIVPRSVELRIAAAFADQPRMGETIEVAFRRKEHALVCAFALLVPLEARALHRRFSQPVTGDPLAASFARLTADRRARLLSYLEDTRRRQAVVAARGAA